jgi:hypothetical protein
LGVVNSSPDAVAADGPIEMPFVPNRGGGSRGLDSRLDSVDSAVTANDRKGNMNDSRISGNRNDSRPSSSFSDSKNVAPKLNDGKVTKDGRNSVNTMDSSLKVEKQVPEQKKTSPAVNHKAAPEKMSNLRQAPESTSKSDSGSGGVCVACKKPLKGKKYCAHCFADNSSAYSKPEGAPQVTKPMPTLPSKPAENTNKLATNSTNTTTKSDSSVNATTTTSTTTASSTNNVGSKSAAPGSLRRVVVVGQQTPERDLLCKEIQKHASLSLLGVIDVDMRHGSEEHLILPHLTHVSKTFCCCCCFFCLKKKKK